MKGYKTGQNPDVYSSGETETPTQTPTKQ